MCRRVVARARIGIGKHACVPTQNGRANSGSRYDAVQWRLASLQIGKQAIGGDVRDDPRASGTLPDRLPARIRLL